MTFLFYLMFINVTFDIYLTNLCEIPYIKQRVSGKKRERNDREKRRKQESEKKMGKGQHENKWRKKDEDGEIEAEEKGKIGKRAQETEIKMTKVKQGNNDGMECVTTERKTIKHREGRQRKCLEALPSPTLTLSISVWRASSKTSPTGCHFAFSRSASVRSCCMSSMAAWNITIFWRQRHIVLCLTVIVVVYVFVLCREC